jgi:hypothetical protein
MKSRICAVAGALVLSACASTTIDTSITEAPAFTTTTTLPSGPASELLPRLVTEAGKLSDVIGSRGNKGAQIALINNLWDAARPEIESTDGIAAQNFEGAIELCRKGAKFNRPADADKCFRNLQALTDSYLASG